MANEIFPEIRNKLTAPKVALEKMANGERVPREFFKLALKELEKAIVLLQEVDRP